MSSSYSLPRLACSCLLQPTRIGSSASTGAFSGVGVGSLPNRPQHRAAASPFSTTAVDMVSSSSKGKGKEVWGRTCRRTAPLGSICPPLSALRSTTSRPHPTATQLRHNSSQPNPTRYAHESLLSLPDQSSAAAARKGKGARLGFFSRSANQAKPTSKDAASTAELLPPPSTSPLVPVHAPLPVALPPTKLSDGLPNPAIRWREAQQGTLREDLTMYQQISKVSLSRTAVC